MTINFWHFAKYRILLFLKLTFFVLCTKDALYAWVSLCICNFSWPISNRNWLRGENFLKSACRYFRSLYFWNVQITIVDVFYQIIFSIVSSTIFLYWNWFMFPSISLTGPAQYPAKHVQIFNSRVFFVPTTYFFKKYEI